MDKHTTTVIFRTYKKSGIVAALFPCTLFGDKVGTYSYISGYGECDYLIAISRTRAATPQEADRMTQELSIRGYNLSIRQRRPSRAYTRKWLAAGNW